MNESAGSRLEHIWGEFCSAVICMLGGIGAGYVVLATLSYLKLIASFGDGETAFKIFVLLVAVFGPFWLGFFSRKITLAPKVSALFGLCFVVFFYVAEHGG